MPNESEILSAMAITNNEPTILNFGSPALLKPIINAKQVMMAEVAPKLNLVRCDTGLKYFSIIFKCSPKFEFEFQIVSFSKNGKILRRGGDLNSRGQSPRAFQTRAVAGLSHLGKKQVQ